VGTLLVGWACAGPQRPAPPPARPAAPTVEERIRAYEHYLHARLHIESTQTEPAIAELQVAIAADPNDPHLRVELARLFHARGRVMPALTQCALAQRAAPRFAPVHLLQGVIHRDTRNRAAAVEAFQRAIELAPQDEEAYLELGALQEDQGRDAQANRSYRELVRAVPSSGKGWFRLGELALRREDLEAAEHGYRQAVQHAPELLNAHLQLITVLRAQEKMDAALQAATRAFHMHPLDELAQLMAELHLALGQTRLATTYLNTIRDAHLGEAETLFGIGRTYQEAGAYEEAARVFGDILEFDAHHHQARVHYGNALWAAGGPEPALAEFRRVPAFSPYYPFARLQTARILQDRGQLDEAQAIYRELLRAQPSDENLYALLADNYLRRNDAATAIRVLRDGLVHMPRDLHLRYRLGTVYERTGRFHRAVRELQRVLERDPEHVDTLTFLGYALARRGIRLGEAEALLQRAQTLRPNDGRVARSLGWVHYKLGKLKQALAELEEAHRLLPHDAQVQDHLGDVCRALGQRERARALYLGALRERPEEPLRTELLDKLRALRGEGAER